MKQLLIVGGTGFLGYHVSKALVNKFKIISISKNNPKKNRFIKKVKYLKVDISTKNSLKKIENKISKITHIINFGGYVNHSDKKRVFKTHYEGAKNLINFFLNKDVEMFIQIGSSMEYGKKISPQKEKSTPSPISHYGKAKLLATNFALNVYKKKKFPIFIIRPYQVYGPNQDSNKLIPFVINQSLKDNNFPCSSGNQFRDFLYISDFVSCIRLFLKNKVHSGQVFNVGYGKPLKIKNVIKSINNKIKLGKPLFGKINLRKEEQKFIYPNIDKTKKILRWRPKIKFDNGINKTIKFFKIKNI